MEQVRDTRERHAVNRARRAVSLHTYQTNGWGEFVEPTPFLFQTSFVDRPNFAYGVELVDTDADGDSQDLTDFRFPRGHAVVYKWKRTDNGLYVGAWVAMMVDTVGTMSYVAGTDYASSDPGYILDFHLHFTGIAIKSLTRAAT
jgi:hypothetical protein